MTEPAPEPEPVGATPPGVPATGIGRIFVRRKQSWLQAWNPRPGTTLELPDGTPVLTRRGDIAISHGSSVVQVVTRAEFDAQFVVEVDGQLTLSPLDCHALDETLGLGATRTVPDFLRAVDRLASLRFGDIRIPFTPGQLAEIQHRASKRGRTIQAEMQAVVDRIRDELFHHGG